MPRFIDADALQLEPDPWGGMNGVICCGRSGGKTMATIQAALKCMIDNAPTVDAVEVVHADWKDCENADFVYCTHCKKEWNVFDNRAELFYYCPNCGAKMDGERREA